MNKLYIDSFVEKKLTAGVQLLDEKDFPNLEQEDQLVQLVTKANRPLGMAYISKQNKGIGWYLGSTVTQLSKAYFIDLFTVAKSKSKQQFAQSDLTNAYRLFNQEGDNFGGLTVDLYKDFAVFSWYNAFVYQEKEMIIDKISRDFP